MHLPRHWLLSISTVDVTDSNNENVLVLYFHSKRNKIKLLCATGLTKKERTTHFGQNITLLIVTSALESSGVWTKAVPNSLQSRVSWLSRSK